MYLNNPCSSTIYVCIHVHRFCVCVSRYMHATVLTNDRMSFIVRVCLVPSLSAVSIDYAYHTLL